VKRVTGSGTINMTQDNGTTWTPITITGSYTQVSIPAQTTTNPVIGFQIVTSGDAIAVDYVMHEEASFPSVSPIYTTTTAVSRSGDSLTYPEAGNASQTVGSAYAEIYRPGEATASATASFLMLQNANGLVLYLSPSSPVTQMKTYDGANVAIATGLTSLQTGQRKRASAWGAGAISVTGDGAAPVSNTFDGTMGDAVSTVSIGAGAGSEPFSYIRNVSLWTRKLSNAELQAKTT
jgi:hypothetical protein